MASTTDILNPCDQAFEDRYQRSASDPHNAEMLSVWRDGWAASRLQQGDAEMRAALTLAVDHLDMDALRISHCKDAAAIDAARQSSAGGEGQP